MTRQIPMQTDPNTPPMIQIRGLKTHFFTDDGLVKAVEGVDLDIHANRTLCLLGESGCGKSILARSILRIVDAPGRIVAGNILYRAADGRTVDLARARPGSRELRDIRGQDIAMIFQEPMSSLGPIQKIGKQITETIRLHRDVSKAEAREEAIDMLARVGIPRMDLYTNAKMRENLSLYPRLGWTEVARRTEDGFEHVYFEKSVSPHRAKIR